MYVAMCPIPPIIQKVYDYEEYIYLNCGLTKRCSPLITVQRIFKVSIYMLTLVL